LAGEGAAVTVNDVGVKRADSVVAEIKVAGAASAITQM